MSYMEKAIDNDKQHLAFTWFLTLREEILLSLSNLEQEISGNCYFERKSWQHHQRGGGEMAIIKGNLFEKAGVNISAVSGVFDDEFSANIPGTTESNNFFACGVSLVIHPKNPFVPITHFNTRYIETREAWFGGGADLTPVIADNEDTTFFHNAFKVACDKHDKSYYPRFKKWCDEYFYIKHRREARGVGGIFYDYLKGDYKKNLNFTKDIGKAFLECYPKIVRNQYDKDWLDEHVKLQMLKRAKYVEFNLIYDRGTLFGLKTGGNVEAILMSLPPSVGWI